MTRVGRRNDALDLQVAAVVNRHLGAGGDVTRKGFTHGEPLVNALVDAFAPSGLFGNRIQHRQPLRIIAHQLPSERERILARSMGQFVDERFHVDRVLIHVDTAPETRRHVRVAHGVVDQQIRHRVADRVFAFGHQPLEHEHVDTVTHPVRVYRRQNGLP